MEINTIKAYECRTPRAMFNNRAQNPQPEQKVSFTSRNDKPQKNQQNNDEAAKMRKAILTLTAMLASTGAFEACSSWEPEAYAKAESYASVDDTTVIQNKDTTFLPPFPDAKTDTVKIRDTIYIDDRGTDTVYIDTGSYHHDVDTIIKWRDTYQRPIPLDSIIKDLKNFDIDSTDVDWTDPNAKRNIIHWEADREWEYNDKEISDMNVLQSSRRNLVYDVVVKDYKGQPIDRQKVLFRYIGSLVPVVENGRRTSAHGYYVEVRDNKNGNVDTDVIDCDLIERVFVRTDGDTVRVYRKNSAGDYEYDGDAAKGYLNANSILLKNLIGEYETDDHLVNVKVSTVDDETLKALYIRKRDESEYAAEAKRR